MKTKLSFILMGILCMLNGCRDKDATQPGYQRKPPALKYYKFSLGEARSYLLGKTGSYWIYKNSKTDDLDTQTVVAINFDNVILKGTTNLKNITVEYERLGRSIYSSFNERTLSDVTEDYELNSLRFLKTVIRRVGAGSVNLPFFHPFIDNDRGGIHNSFTTFKGLDSVFVLRGNTYYNVAKFDIDKDGISEQKLGCKNPNTVYYWAKDVGIIKKEMNGCGYAWELVEYHIIQ